MLFRSLKSDEKKETKGHMGKGEGASMLVDCCHVDETIEDPSLVVGLFSNSPL